MDYKTEEIYNKVISQWEKLAMQDYPQLTPFTLPLQDNQ